ncbi:MAG: hypothetical protein EOO20_19570 [Chryseobacterium sp.]|nr:MAG: hypothetical protein EOO20_19570 [Chryseobacterium sp.]
MEAPIINITVDQHDYDRKLSDAVKQYYLLDKKLLTGEIEDNHFELTGILEEKRLALSSNEPTIHSRLLSEIQREFVDVQDQAYKPFPNYAFRVPLGEHLAGHVQTSTGINLVVSLLTNMFTVFYEDWVKIDGINILGGPFATSVLSENQAIKDPEGKLFSKLKDIASSALIDYEFIPYQHLFYNTIPVGSVYNLGGVENYPVYNYLFDLNYLGGNYLSSTGMQTKHSLQTLT